MTLRRPGRSTVVVLLLVAAATAGRLAYAYWVHAPGKSVFSDMAVYHRQGRHLQAGTLDPSDTFFPMGYPALIAGASSITDSGLRLIAVIQAAAGGLTCLLAYAIARRFSLPVGWAIGALIAVALYPPFLFYGSMLLTEAISPLLFTLTIWLMLVAIDRPTWWRAVLLGIAFSTAGIVRTNFLPFALVIAACVWIGRGRRFVPALRLLTVAGLAALPLLVVTSYTNSMLTGRWSGPSTNGGLNFFMMQAEISTTRSYDESVAPIRNLLKYRDVFNSRVPLYDEPYYYKEGVRLILARPGPALARSVDNLREAVGLGAQVFWPEPRAGPARDWREATVYPALRRALRWCARAFLFVLVLPPFAVVVALAARRRLFRPDRVAWIAVLGTFVLMLMTSLLFLADPRMHVPFDALLLVASVDALRRATIIARGVSCSWRARKVVPG